MLPDYNIKRPPCQHCATSDSEQWIPTCVGLYLENWSDLPAFYQPMQQICAPANRVQGYFIKIRLPQLRSAVILTSVKEL